MRVRVLVGTVLPCHAAETLRELEFPPVLERSLQPIWCDAPAFQRFRGTSWMPEPCRTCELREIDWGGCRCQAFALTGDAAATDSACSLSPDHALMHQAVAEAAAASDDSTYRRLSRDAKRPHRRSEVFRQDPMGTSRGDLQIALGTTLIPSDRQILLQPISG